ncbi:MAG TPA: AAA family ATPase [Mycobacteriales bacterium]|nr:AAA family ATPase [Mycobacteriales bacterium]
MHARPALCPVQIGRDSEIAVLAEHYDELVTGGSGAMLLIAGEAGVGKSRLAAEARRLAEERGLARLVGHCAAEAGIPYGPFVTAIRRRIRTLDDEELRALFSGPAMLATALLPEVAQAASLPATSPGPEDLYLAVWQLLYRLSQPTGALLLLEDLHWADIDSLRMLSYLARELSDLPVLIVGTYRRDELHRRHPLTGVLAELSRERRYDEITLDPLDKDDTRRMLSAIFDGTDVGDEFADAVLERTAGNPFFVEELAKVLVERGDIYAEAGDWVRRDLAAIEMPLTVRETLLARTRDLDATTLDVLKLAAVAGERLDAPVLALAAEVSAERIDDAVRDGLRLQLLTERHEGGLTSYGFRHALTREALADELVGPDRQRARRRLAQAIVTVHDGDLDAWAAELADHFAEAGDVAAAIEYGTRAARRATASFALEEASRRYERVLQLIPPGADERLDLLLEATAAVLSGPDLRLGVVFATEARALARARSDPIKEMQAVRALEYERWLSGDGRDSTALSREALALIHGHDDYAEAMAYRHLTRRLTLVDRGEEAMALLPAGIELAERSGNLAALSGLHGTRMLMSSLGPEFDEAYAASLAAAVAAEDIDAERNVTINAGYLCVWGGDLARSGASFRRAIELTERYAPHDRYTGAGYAWLLSLTGDYDEAVSLATPLRRAGDTPSQTVALMALCEVADRTGDPALTELIDELSALALPTEENQRIAPALAAKARQTLAVDGVTAAAPLFWEVLRTTTYAEMRTGAHWLFSPDFAGALAEAGRTEELAAWVSEIEQRTGNDKNPHNLAAQRLCEAYLASSRGETDASRKLFGDAVDRYRAMPCPARETEALLGLADLEWRAGHLDASVAAGRDALAVAERIGATTLAAAAQTTLARTDSTSILASVLVTDIVGSTARAATLGDRAWQDLLGRHHAIVRRELARLGGHEIDTAGDGFLVWFSSPAQAIRCAEAVRDALAQIDVTIRAGVHTGECRQTGEKLTGIAVHIASRVASSAGAGQVLVSGTVRELVTGSGFRFDDQGEHEFKGVPGSWRIYSVIA